MSQIMNNTQQTPQDDVKESSTATQDKTNYYNDANLQISNLFLTKTASIAFLELQGANGRKFHLSENVMRQILLPDHANQNQNTTSLAGSLLKRIHLQKIFIQPGVYCEHTPTQNALDPPPQHIRWRVCVPNPCGFGLSKFEFLPEQT